ncbi:MAG TPA: DUF309 domain-containing protein [Terriglobales bacterium]|nr:DUF309 domain-containing protein [Terriglobales bacterium]
MNSLFLRGLDLFNAGRYFDAHEVWEDLWRETDGPDKLLVQGLVQSAVALHHASTGNYVGARSVMERAITNIGGCRVYKGADVAQMRRELRQACDQMDRQQPFAAWVLPQLRRSAPADEP